MALTPVRTEARFRRRYKKKAVVDPRAIDGAVTQLRIDHRHPGLRTSAIQGRAGVFEARIDGSNRLTFHWAGTEIVLRTNCRHDDVYRNP